MTSGENVRSIGRQMRPQGHLISLRGARLLARTSFLEHFQLLIKSFINPLSANPTKLSNTLKQFVGKLATNSLSVFDHFVKLALKGLNNKSKGSNNLLRHSHWFFFILGGCHIKYVQSIYFDHKGF